MYTYSEVLGAESQCIQSTAGEGLCIKDDMTLRIQVLGAWITCTEDFQRHAIPVGQGLVRTTIICRRLSQACPISFARSIVHGVATAITRTV